MAHFFKILNIPYQTQKVATGTYVCLKTDVLKTEIEQFPSFLRSQFEGIS